MTTPISLYVDAAGTFSLYLAPGLTGVAFELADGYEITPGRNSRPPMIARPGEPGMPLSEAIKAGVLCQVSEEDRLGWHSRVLDRIANSVLPYLVAILAHRPGDRTPNGILFGATGFLVKTAKTQFLVTAEHVSRAIFADGVVPVVLGDGPPLEISPNIIDADDRLDVATIEVPPEFDPKLISRRFCTNWPPTRAVPGDSAIVIGFPGADRIAGARTLQLKGTIVSCLVSSVNDRQFVLADEDGERVFTRGSPGPTGGMSGAPAFVAGYGEPKLAGILSDGGVDTSGMLFCSHADFIDPDGRIDRSLPR